MKHLADVRSGPLTVAVAVIVLVAVVSMIFVMRANTPTWSAQELEKLQSLSIDQLGPPPADPSNRYADNQQAAVLGQRLFFDPRFSGNEQVACASCHRPERSFTDGAAFATGMGTTGRSTPSVLASAYSPWLFWDGRKDSLWAQALGPMESPVEHGGTRTRYARVIAQHYRAEYEALFGPLPADFSDEQRFPAHAGPLPDPVSQAAWNAMSAEDRQAVTQVYANMGKAIAAYERLIRPGEARFDRYMRALRAGDSAAMAEALSADEIAGARLFIGKANCASCHTGPLLTDNGFHNINVPAVAGKDPDVGRVQGIKQVLEDEFNCFSQYSDATPDQCQNLVLLASAKTEGTEGAFRTPTLRNISDTGPYMHAGQFGTLREVVEHYNTGIPNDQLGLTETEIDQLTAFLHTLQGEVQMPR